MSIKLTGNWKKGLAFDVHTLSSTYLGTDQFGHDQWDTKRSEMGELVYRLKYQQDRSCLPKIVDLLEKIKGIHTFDYIVPIPPSNQIRGHQPVRLIADALGERHEVKVLPNLLRKEKARAELKNIDDLKKRKALLSSTMMLSQKHDISGREILLVDDLYRSGTTLRVATDLLLKKGGAAAVCVLTMTKTRSIL